MHKPIVLAAAALAAAAGHGAAQQHLLPTMPGYDPGQARAQEQRQREFHNQVYINRPAKEAQDRMQEERLGRPAGGASHESERRRRRGEEDRRTRDAREARGTRSGEGRAGGGGPWSASPWSATPWSDEPWRRGAGGAPAANPAPEAPSSGARTPPIPDAPALRAATAGDPPVRRGEPRRR